MPQRAKSMLWDQHQLVIARVPLESEAGALSTPQVCLLIGREYVVTFQERPFGFFEPVRQRLRDGVGQIRTRGPDYLAWALVDTLVDHYYPVVESQAAALDRLEDSVLREATPELLAEVHRVRRQIAVLRRVGGPQREAISELMRDPSPFVSDAVRVYLRDTYDHISQIMEMADASREAAVGIVDLYLSSLSHRTSEVIKVLTLMTSLFIPLTFVVGVYGMNFDYMPELRQPIAYPAVMVAMLAIALGMIFYFRRRGWIGGSRKRRRRR
jgi:magnesium transporter